MTGQLWITGYDDSVQCLICRNWGAALIQVDDGATRYDCLRCGGWSEESIDRIVVASRALWR